MKKVMMAVCLVGIMALPVVAMAGTAYLPHFAVNGNEQTYCRTVVQISSIDVDQAVTITLYNIDGSPLANQNIIIYYGSMANPTTTTTSTEGTITQNIAANKTLHIVLNPNSATDWTQGYGKIVGSKLGLIASAHVRDLQSASGVGTTYQRSITINGGNPF